MVSLDSGIEPGTEGVGGRFGLSHAGEGDQDGHHERKEGLGESGVFWIGMGGQGFAPIGEEFGGERLGSIGTVGLDVHAFAQVQEWIARGFGGRQIGIERVGDVGCGLAGGLFGGRREGVAQGLGGMTLFGNVGTAAAYAPNDGNRPPEEKRHDIKRQAQRAFDGVIHGKAQAAGGDHESHVEGTDAGFCRRLGTRAGGIGSSCVA